MRVHSIYAMQGKSEKVASRQALPAEGSKIRLIYDIFYEHRGTQIPDADWEALLELIGTGKTRIKNNNLLRSHIAALQDFWGCDIRRLPGQRRAALVGEWSGKVYLDYTREAREQACQDSSGLQPGTSTPGS